MKDKKIILFLCYGNAYRSQWAEAFFNRYNHDKEFIAKSGGAIQSRVFPDSVELMKEKRIDISSKKSKKVTQEILDEAYKIYDFDGEVADSTGNPKIKKVLLTDPISNDIETKRKIRDEIEAKIKEILKELEN